MLISGGHRPGLGKYLGDLVRSRALAWSIAHNDLMSRHGSYFFGWLWNLLDPLLMLGVYWLVFGLLLAGRRPEDFLAFLAIGIFLFRFIQGSVVGGASSVSRNVGMVRQVRFPRAVLPLAEMLKNFFQFVWQLPIVLLIVLATTGVLRAGWIIFVLVLLPLASVFALGGALLFARLAASFADVTKLLPYGFRILFYASGVLFPISALVGDHPFGPVVLVNPIYAFVALARHLVLEPAARTGILWTFAALWSCVSFGVGLVVFLSAEHRYGRG